MIRLASWLERIARWLRRRSGYVLMSSPFLQPNGTVSEMGGTWTGDAK